MKDNKERPNKGFLLEHSFITKIITDKNINANKDKKLVLLFKFIEFIERVQDQDIDIHDEKTFKKETDNMINKYVYNILNTSDNTQIQKQTQKHKQTNKTTTQLINERNEEKYQKFMSEYKQSELNSNKRLLQQSQNKINIIKKNNNRVGIIHNKEIKLSSINTKILTKNYLIKFFSSILGSTTIKKLDLSNSLNTNNFDDTIFNLLLKYIEDNTTIEELNISNCNINYDKFNKIVDAMIKNLNLHENDFKMSRLIFNNNNIIPYSDFSKKVNNTTMRDFNTTLQNLMIEIKSLQIVSFRNCFLNNDFLKEIARWLPNTSIKEFDLSFNYESNSGSINDTDIVELVKILKEDDKYKNTDNIIINLRGYFIIGDDTITNENSIKLNNITIIANDNTIKEIKTKLNL